MSYSETPFVDGGDHLEPLTASGTSAEGSLQSRYYFSTMTAIVRTGNANSAGEYLYTVTTSGEWSINTILGGERYPSYGDDFVLQFRHKDMMLLDSAMLVLYDDGEYGGSDHFYLVKDEADYISYAVKDDPLGTKQLSSFILMANYQGPAKTYTRRIRSKYIHTWLGVDFDSIKIDVTFDERGNIKDVETNIDAELKEKAWALPSFVGFNF